MRKIMFMINSLYGGGAEKIFQTLINNLDPNKYDITVYSVNRQVIDTSVYKNEFKYKYIFNSTENAGWMKKLTIKIENKIKLWIYYHCSPELFYKLFVKGQYDVEAAYIEGYATRIISGSSNQKSKKIAWVHIDLIKNHWTDVAFQSLEEEKEAYHKFDHILCVSEDVAKAIMSKFNITDKVAVQYNTVNEMEIVEKSKEDLNFVKKQDVMNFVTLGRLVEQKGYDRLLRIVKKLKDEQYSFFVYILGDGNQKELQEYIKDNKLEHYVCLTGFINNPYPYIKNADAFICSSRAEGFSTVATESLILGKPIITTDCAGMRELFGKCECGIICENNEEDLYSAMKAVLNQTQKLDYFSEQAQQRAEYFKLETRMQEIRSLIDE